MKVWDMHCDTLAELRYAQQAGKPKSFLHNDLMMDLERMKQGDYLLQCMACFVHLEPEREKSPLLACLEEIDIFYRLLEQYPDDLMQVRTAADIQTLLTSGKRGMMLTVEEGGACLDSLGALRDLYRLGVRMMTLTWNFKNGLAEPNIVPGTDDMWPRPANTTGGLTEKGLEFVEEMQRLHMLVDVVVLLAEHIAHGIAGLGADQLALCQQGKKAAHIPRGNGTQLFAPVIAAQAAVQLGVGAANAADKRIDGIQPQIVDQHVGGNVVADNDHQGGNIAGAQPGTFA